MKSAAASNALLNALPQAMATAKKHCHSQIQERQAAYESAASHAAQRIRPRVSQTKPRMAAGQTCAATETPCR